MPPANPMPQSRRVLPTPGEGDGAVGPDHAGGGHHLDHPGLTQGLLAELLEHLVRASCAVGSAVLGRDEPGRRPLLTHCNGRSRGKSRDRCRLGHVGGVHGTGAAHLRGQQPDRSAAAPGRSGSPRGRPPGRRRRHATRGARGRRRRRGHRPPGRQSIAFSIISRTESSTSSSQPSSCTTMPGFSPSRSPSWTSAPPALGLNLSASTRFVQRIGRPRFTRAPVNVVHWTSHARRNPTRLVSHHASRRRRPCTHR